MFIEPEDSNSDITLKKLYVMNHCLKENLPDYNEGWTSIITPDMK